MIAEFPVPGARLHTETHGSGPLLLLIHGGNGDSATFDGIVGPLAEHFTVLTYVRRGYVRSPLDTPPADDADRIAVDVGDAAALIRAHGGEAIVFGSSSGAIVALDLVTRHPDLVRAVVPHEPPILALLDEPDAWAARFAGIRARYEAEGLMPAIVEFAQAVGLTPSAAPAGEPSPGRRGMMARIPENTGFWFEHELEPYPAYRPDIEALGAVADRIVPAVGRVSRETDAMPYRPIVRLAERLGREVAEFPGGHTGYDDQPAGFAAVLLSLVRAGR